MIEHPIFVWIAAGIIAVFALYETVMTIRARKHRADD